MAHMTGSQLIANERLRQIESEGWTPAHDDEHGVEILLLAAQCYRDAAGEGSAQPTLWPWDAGWWKPKSRQRNLERAGALYQAAADTAERAHDFRRRDEIRDHVVSCTILLDSVLDSKAN
jgi:hypothetical protein